MARAARSLDTLLRQINTYAPRRSKKSDGGIADDRHLKVGTSDHIADRSGVFHARDFTHDPGGGFDAYAFAERVLDAQDPRLKYVISNDRIGFGPAGSAVIGGRRVTRKVWHSYAYAGAKRNRHDHHTHVSVAPGALGDQTTDWASVRPKTLLTEEDDMPTADEIAEAVWAKNLKNKAGQVYPARDIFAAVDEHVGVTRERVAHIDEGQDTLAELLRALPKAFLAAAITGVKTRRKGVEAYEDIDVARALARGAEAPISYQRQDDTATDAAATKGTR